MTESDIVNSICDYLQLKRYFFWRQNNLPVFQKDHYRAMPKYSKRGVPDIIIVKDQLFIGLEVKQTKGSLSEHQKKFRDDLLIIGKSPNYYLVRSVEEVIKIGL